MTCMLIPLTIFMVLWGFITEYFGDHIKTFFISNFSFIQVCGPKKQEMLKKLRLNLKEKPRFRLLKQKSNERIIIRHACNNEDSHLNLKVRT